MAKTTKSTTKLKKKKSRLPEFDYVENPKDPGQHAIRITDGPYKGIVYTYGVVGFDEEDEEELTVQFSYDIIENPKKTDVLEDMKFHDIMGDILIIILKYNVSDKTDAGKSGNNDIVELGEE